MQDTRASESITVCGKLVATHLPVARCMSEELTALRVIHSLASRQCAMPGNSMAHKVWLPC